MSCRLVVVCGCALFLLGTIAGGICVGKEPATLPPDPPAVAEASDEGERAISGFSLPEDWEASLFAAEPLLANPVSFTINNAGNIYVCESYRLSRGVEDNRSHEYWVDADLAAKTVEDRRAFMLKHQGEDTRRFTRGQELLRLLWDTDGDAQADKSTIFAGGFHDVITGTGAGVLQRGDDVYYACIPDLWLLRDEDGDGQAEVQRSLHHGYGVHVAFKGHDLHGLTPGPDGRLYFTIGDRGYHLNTAEGLIADPHSGAVFRCNWDGTGLEVVHTGLRNPQELAFDGYGDLFAADNDSDSIDLSRWLPIIDGGDSGWRMAYQYMPDRGPFHQENLWHPHRKDHPAYLAPTIANTISGPAGLAYYPGTGLGEHFRGRFFLCDFRGGGVNSGVHTFRQNRKGAFYELVDREKTLGGMLATDVEFGPDGAVYVTDFVHGWDGASKGRVYRFVDPQQQDAPVVKQVRQLLRDGLQEVAVADLVEFLGHADRRIRMAAQFELVRRGDSARLVGVALDDQRQLARIHALWGLGQLARDENASMPLRRSITRVVQKLSQDRDAEIRGQAMRIVGDAKLAELLTVAVGLFDDEELRVRYQAALALSHVGGPEHVEVVATLLTENANADPMIRHAGIMALTRLADEAGLLWAARHESAAVRLAAAVAMRRRSDVRVAELLTDPVAQIVDEAARAIYEVPIDAALGDLTEIAGGCDSQSFASLNEPTQRRVLNANYRLGGLVEARRVASVAANSAAPEHLRVEALKMLAAWEEPNSRDRLLSLWRPLDVRESDSAINALSPRLAEVLSGPPAVRSEAARSAAALDVREAIPALERLVRDLSQSDEVRSDSLTTLALYETPILQPLLRAMVDDKESLVRIAARRAQANIDPAAAVASIAAGVKATDLRERQAAWETVAILCLPAADDVIAQGLRELLAGQVPGDTQLDLLEAAKKRSNTEIGTLLDQHQASKDDNDSLARYRETLHGGRVKEGGDIFHYRREVSCRRCHTIDGRGGTIGPDLSRVGAEKTREYLLESIVAPNRSIAKGFETVQLVTDDGLVHSGIMISEDEGVVRLVTPQGEKIEIAKDTVEERGTGLSAMPGDVVDKLSLRDIRDLVEFLAAQKAGK